MKNFRKTEYSERRKDCGNDLYKAIKVPKDDLKGKLAQLAKNGDFFGGAFPHNDIDYLCMLLHIWETSICAFKIMLFSTRMTNYLCNNYAYPTQHRWVSSWL